MKTFKEFISEGIMKKRPALVGFESTNLKDFKDDYAKDGDEFENLMKSAEKVIYDWLYGDDYQIIFNVYPKDIKKFKAFAKSVKLKIKDGVETEEVK